jgi:putative ABC transport system permease protein
MIAMLAMLAECRYALRQLARSPGFAAVAILTLALGIGANTAVFSVADAVLLRPLPYPNSDRLVMIWDQLWKIGVRQLPVSATTFDAYRADERVFDAVAVCKEDDRILTGSGYAERVTAISATSGLFEMLGAGTALGRGFTEEDWQPAHTRVAILGYALFARRFGANPSVLGQTVRLDDGAYIVVGVMARDFNFSLHAGAVDIWTPLPPVEDRRKWQFQMLARIRPGIGIEAAQASVTAAARHVEETLHPYRGPNGEDGGYHAIVVPLREQLLGDFRTGALILLSAVALVLLIACANVANLLLARAAAREKEIAVRRALGASNAALIRQCMAEAGVLAALGGAAGAAVSGWGVALLKALSPTDLPGVARIGIDGRALLFMFGISAVVCLLFGAAPALAVTRMNWTLRGSRARRRTSGALVAGEVALALMLLIGAGLLLKSFARLRQIDPGFRPDHLLTMQVQLSGPRYAQPRSRIGFFSAVRQRIATLPGVVSASTVSRLPVARVGLNTRSGNPFSIDGQPWNPNSPAPQIAHTQTVGLDYFRTMGIPLRAGRDFSEADTLDAPPVVIINETLARRFFLKREAIGRHLLLGAPEPGARWMTIVGIIADLRTGALDDQPMPQYYTPQAQEASGSMFVVMRTAGDPLQLAREASGAVRLLDPEVPVYQFDTMEQHVSDAVGQPRFQTVLLALFSAAALFLAAVGIYGVVAHATAQRTKEIGIRMALGADAAQVVATVLADGLRPVAAGIVLGLAGAIALARLLSSVLFQVAPRDPAAFAWAVAMLALTAAVACLAPARRAALLDPQIALREE